MVSILDAMFLDEQMLFFFYTLVVIDGHLEHKLQEGGKVCLLRSVMVIL